jgi:ELWxxDGT repeat protein
MRICHTVALVVALFVAASGQAQVGGTSSSPQRLIAAGDQVFFTAETRDAGRELWRTDGTAAGTRLVIDLTPGPQSTAIATMLTDGHWLFFVTQSPRELWRTDGTAAGTSRIAGDPWTWPLGTVPNGVIYTDRVFPSRISGAFAPDFVPRLLTTFADQPFAYVSFRGIVYFRVGVNARTIWRTDGTPEGTFVFFSSQQPAIVLPAGEALYLLLADGELRRVDAAGDSTPVALLGRAGDAFAAAIPGALIVKTQPEVFRAHLWRVDAGGGSLLVTLPRYTGRLYAIGDRIIFDAHSEFWVSDGTVAGTSLVTRSLYMPGNGLERAVLGSHLFFVASTVANAGRLGAPPFELYRTDGTTAGTGPLRAGDGAPANPSSLVSWRDVILFAAEDPVHGAELWRTDGTAAGTRLVANVAPESAVEGRVTDAATDAPLPGITIELYAAYLGPVRLFVTATTDAGGRYRFDGLRPGTYFLRTRNAVGYIDQLHRRVPCTPCEVSKGTPIVVPDQTTLTGYDFALTRGSASKRRAAH